MKLFSIIFILTLSLSSFAKSVDEAVKEVEVEKHVVCTFIKASTVSRCLGMPNSCFYSIKYRCDSAADFFGLSVKVKEIYRFGGEANTITVRGLKFTK